MDLLILQPAVSGQLSFVSLLSGWGIHPLGVVELVVVEVAARYTVRLFSGKESEERNSKQDEKA